MFVAGGAQGEAAKSFGHLSLRYFSLGLLTLVVQLDLECILV